MGEEDEGEKVQEFPGPIRAVDAVRIYCAAISGSPSRRLGRKSARTLIEAMTQRLDDRRQEVACILSRGTRL